MKNKQFKHNLNKTKRQNSFDKIQKLDSKKELTKLFLTFDSYYKTNNK